MELLKEAKNVVDFATYYPLLNKATIDNDTPTPGYLFEEIIKLSHQSSGHRQHLVDFMLARLQISSWPGKQKVVRILHQVSSRGHLGVRIYLRGKDSELRKAASAGGPPDPVLANTPQLFLSSAIQELLTLLFDPKIMREDEMVLAGKIDTIESLCGDNPEQSLIGQGYGSSAPKGKYEGFGSTPINRGDNLVNQMRDMVERVMSPSGDGKRNEITYLQGDKGDYQPLSLPSLGSSMVGPAMPVRPPHLSILARSHSQKYRAHRKGRPGGGWDSDDEVTEFPTSPLSSDIEISLAPSDQTSIEIHSSGGMSEEEFLANFLQSQSSWPIDHDDLVKTCQECTSFNLNTLLEKVLLKLDGFIKVKVQSEGDCSDKSSINIPSLPVNLSSEREVLPPAFGLETSQFLCLLLFIEFGIHYDVFAPSLVNNVLGKVFQNIQGNENVNSAVRIKARKLSLIVHKLI